MCVNALAATITAIVFLTVRDALVNPCSPSRCERCLRPAGQCLCALIPQIATTTRLLVIQHPSERRHALNTARFLVEGVVGAQLLVAEKIDLNSVWYQMLSDPDWHTEVLFPGAGHSLLSASVDIQRPRRLVLLDGTWRKARKLLYLNPVLQSLPKVALPEGLVSRYRLRKAPQPGSLSTLEAGVEALRRIDQSTDFSPLLRPFEALIEGQIDAMGLERYRENYLRRGR